MGVTLVPGGATFKVWGLLAQAMHLNGTFAGAANWSQDTNPGLLLNMDGAGYWTGFLANVADGDQYKYYVVGQPGEGHQATIPKACHALTKSTQQWVIRGAAPGS